MPCRVMKFHFGTPPEPRLVMTWMTPFDASVPYNAAAAGPFRISIDSMSSGLRSLIREIDEEPKS